MSASVLTLPFSFTLLKTLLNENPLWTGCSAKLHYNVELPCRDTSCWAEALLGWCNWCSLYQVMGWEGVRQHPINLQLSCWIWWGKALTKHCLSANSSFCSWHCRLSIGYHCCPVCVVSKHRPSGCLPTGLLSCHCLLFLPHSLCKGSSKFRRKRWGGGESASLHLLLPRALEGWGVSPT